MAASMSQVVVFHTVELLELVLLYLERTDIYKCQRINRHFRDVILESTTLKQKLFRAPGPYQKGLEEVVYCCPNMYLVRDKNYQPPRRNLCPSFFILDPSQPSATEENNKGKKVEYALSLPSPVTDLASWKNMYITSPPVVEVYMCLAVSVTPPSGYMGWWRTQGSFRDERGLTFGRLLELGMADKPSVAEFKCMKCKRWRRRHAESLGPEDTIATEVAKYTREYGGQPVLASNWTSWLEFDIHRGFEMVSEVE